ncbi:nodal modulator 1-like [Acanthaster planci]|uniref:Nodal modulator 1-like n=1 Tax=Acanthaster planci TaxID=133434 RepID=A0A8B7Z556_ACAPL|nr:nodal modulator 1-like [Acanthaster planci]
MGFLHYFPNSCLVVCSLCTLINADDFLGCGGFVKSDVEINFSRVEVKLYTRTGALKYQTDCAPNNGYFMIPIYDKGDFTLKVEPPQGWSFEPTSVDLHIDGETDKCSRSEDINFQFTGFVLNGQVLSKGQSEGPAGVSVSLTKQGEKEPLVQSATKTGGGYIFKQVLPGEYTLGASHPKWTFVKDTLPITVAKDSSSPAPTITISGYDVTGHVMSEGEPIKDVHFLLFSDTVSKEEISQCDTTPVKGFTGTQAKTPLCSVTSTDEGKITFPSLPSGQYTMVPFYQGEHITFDVMPTSMDFSVAHDSVTLPTTFRVEGFSVSGRILDSKRGNGIPGVKVKVQDRSEVISKADGTYQLIKITSGTYVVTASKDNIFFEPETMKINPNTPRLPDIIASRFSLCGRIVIDKLPAMLPSSGKRRVSLIPEGGAAKDTVSVATDNAGAFCFTVKPGSFSVQPTLNTEEVAAGLKLIPSQQKVQVQNAPVLGINFSQFKAVIRGVIKCIDVCGTLQITLHSEGGVEERSPAQISQSSKTAPFLLRDVLPGKYKVTVIQNHWCWQTPSLDIQVTDGDVTSLEFVQTGYQLQCHVSHPIAMLYHNTKSPKQSKQIDLNKGLNEFCLEKSGSYRLTPLSCHRFEHETYSFDTSSPAMLALTATKHLMTGAIVAKQPSSDVTVSIRSSIEAEPLVQLGPLKSQKELEEEAKKTVKPAKKGNATATDEETKVAEDTGPYVYEFTYWARNGEKLIITPSSQVILFYPAKAQVTIQTGDDCLGKVVDFEGRAGVFLSGQVQPGLAGVKISVTSRSLEDKEVRPAINVETGKDGRYRIGPLPDTAEYNVQAALEGYVLTKVEGTVGDFKASKLGEITIEVVDEGGLPLQGVLLSLSGGTFRSNNLTQASGSLVFTGLGPDQYFLRALMKEYKFEPGSQMINVEEGSTFRLKIKGSRVAFSCYGMIASLNGEPEPDIALEAQGVGDCGQVVEEGISDQEGKFRIRGLQPECSYELQLKSGDVNSHIERAAPKTQIIKVQGKDIDNLHIIVFRRLNQFDIGGNIITPSEHLATLKVLLYSEDNLVSPVHTLSLGSSSFFQFPSLPNDGARYVMRLESSLSKSSWDYTLPEASFSTDGYFKHITLQFNPERRAVDQEVSSGSHLALPLIAALIAIGLNHAKILPILQQLGLALKGFRSPGGSEVRDMGGAGDQDTRPKKKPRTRKT